MIVTEKDLPTQGSQAKFDSKRSECSVCFVRSGERCRDQAGNVIPTHVERARASRWAQMGAEL